MVVVVVALSDPTTATAATAVVVVVVVVAVGLVAASRSWLLGSRRAAVPPPGVRAAPDWVEPGVVATVVVRGGVVAEVVAAVVEAEVAEGPVGKDKGSVIPTGRIAKEPVGPIDVGDPRSWEAGIAWAPRGAPGPMSAPPGPGIAPFGDWENSWPEPALAGMTPIAGWAGVWAGPTVGTTGAGGVVVSRVRGSATAPTPATVAKRRSAVTRVADCTVTDIDVV